MSRLTIRLVERQTTRVVLPPREVAFLLTQARELVEVRPCFQPNVYRITPRGFVGWFDGPSRRFAIRPQVPWPTLQLLLGFRPTRQGHEATGELETELLMLMAEEFLHRLGKLERNGLFPGYHEQDSVAPFLRGKLRTVEQLREAAVRAFPDRFQIRESVLGLDTPWNRILRATASHLLAQPHLPSATRKRLQVAICPLECIPAGQWEENDFSAAIADRRLSHYQPVLEVCRLIHSGFTAASTQDGGSTAFLMNLGQVFERYLGMQLVRAYANLPNWSVQVQPRLNAGVAEFQPDFIISKDGQAEMVFDAKWKHPRPEASDLHQVLAYGNVTGAKHVGLVYPGRRLAKRSVILRGRTQRLTLLQVPIFGMVTDNWLPRLSRWLRKHE